MNKKKQPIKFQDIVAPNTKNQKYISVKIPKIIFGYLVVAITIGIITILGILYFNHHKNDNQRGLKQVESLVGKHILLPANEIPTLATITDHDKLDHSNILYTKGKNGDRVLIYVQASRVYIYRPSIDKVVDVGPVSVDQGVPESKNTTINILDSTNRPNIAQAIKNKVQTAYPYTKVTINGQTNRANFPNTIVIDNTNQKDNLEQDLISLLKAKRGVVPLSEAKQNSDMEIIIGTDYQ